MGIKKMSLATIQGKLSRQEMKNIMAGSGGSGYGTCCTPQGDCGGISGCTQWSVCNQIFKKCGT
jgi:hypothetical protein